MEEAFRAALGPIVLPEMRSLLWGGDTQRAHSRPGRGQSAATMDTAPPHTLL